MNGHLRPFSQLAAAAVAEVRHHRRLLPLPLHPPLRVLLLPPLPLPRIRLHHILPPPVRLRAVVGDDEVAGGCVAFVH